jgi:hypothetical protein
MLTNYGLIVNKQVELAIQYVKIINKQHKKIFLITFFELNFRTELKIRQHTTTH